jgi:hypothetical protein
MTRDFLAIAVIESLQLGTLFKQKPPSTTSSKNDDSEYEDQKMFMYHCIGSLLRGFTSCNSLFIPV